MKRVPTVPITFKVTPTERDELLRVVKAASFDSVSNAIRAGLGLLYEKWGMKPQTDLQIEAERKRHKPRFSSVAFEVKPTPVVKELPKPKKHMSAIRARKSSV
jgi:Arc/MetJ-type ribon-helix-helix transcriptional regulator